MANPCDRACRSSASSLTVDLRVFPSLSACTHSRLLLSRARTGGASFRISRIEVSNERSVTDTVLG
jgi:hypothetical protein